MNTHDIIEIERSVSYLWGSCRALLPVISISIAFTATIEIIFRFILLRRNEKRAMKRIEERFEKFNRELTEEQEKVFWAFLKRKVNS